MTDTVPAQDPSTKSSEYRAMEPAWEMISDILAGAQAVRLKGTAYLPKYEDELIKEYERRRSTAPWRPEFADALRTLAAKPFDEEVALLGDVPESMKAVSEDVDGRGNSLTIFSAETFAKAIAKGLHAIFVDYPTMEPNATKAAEKAAGARPYWVQIQADNILALYTTVENGREVVTHVRLRECAVERDGFAEVKIERIRVLEPGSWELWEKRAPSLTFTKVDEGVIARGPKKLTSIPLVLFFTGERIGELQVKPPLADLAQMQIELYQALSRQDEVLTFAGSPMLCGKGLAAPENGAPISVGPKRILFAPPGGAGQPTGWEFIQPDAKNITEIRNHVTSIIDDMRRLGMQPLTQRSGTATATGQSIEAAKAHSAVKAWAHGLKDAIEQAWTFTAEWMGEEPNVEVRVATDFSVLPYAQAPLDALDKARERGDIGLNTYWDSLRRFDVLAPDFDHIKEEVKVAAERADATARAAALLKATPEAPSQIPGRPAPNAAA